MTCLECGKSLGLNNVSGYCSDCLPKIRSRRNRLKRNNLKRCYDCGIKVNPIVTYPDGENNPKVKKINYPRRCYKCREKRNNKNEM